MISLFSGAMGLDLGLERTGFRIAVAVERNPYAVATIKKNRPDLPIIDRPIEDVTTSEILKAAGLRRGEAFLVAGGPSCQVFSTAGQRGSLGDPRGALFEHFIRVVAEARPRYFVMENVRGLLSAAVKHRPLIKRGPGHPSLKSNEELGSAFRIVASKLRSLGYYVNFDVLNSADFGVPQVRHRLVFLGSRDGRSIKMPDRTHSESPSAGQKKWRTLRSAIGRLKENAPEYYDFCPAQKRYLARIPAGGNWRDLPAHLKRRALGSAFDSWGGRSGFYRRLDWEKPSPALTTRPDSKATILCHPTKVRPLTVREYARVQQFPDSWRFVGTVRKKYEQIGNAVPIGLGEAIGRAIRRAARSRSAIRNKRRVECHNLDVLAKLTRRPRIIVNPPRMRLDTKKRTLAHWLKDLPRTRNDAFDYVPYNKRAKFKGLVGGGAKTTSRHANKKGANPRRNTRKARARKEGYRSSARKVWLTAAE